MKNDPELDRLVREAEARFAALTPDQQEEQRRLQRESWARGMAPCEHGMVDWEDCAQCQQARK